MFQYLMKLHYSQTSASQRNRHAEFQYLMKLHYSQTPRERLIIAVEVSVPYEITLLSNCCSMVKRLALVSVPYEITLLSNLIVLIVVCLFVSVPYEITLLSNPHI